MTTPERYAEHVLPTYGRFPLVPVRGAGCRLWDDAGKSYLDFCMGIAVCSLGHCHPRLVEAIRHQAGELIHVSNLYQHPLQAELAEEINEHHVRLPGKIFFSNSGAEANDGLIKAARRFGQKRPHADGTRRYEVLTFLQSFHGRTLGSMAATGQAKIQEGFDPLLPGFRHLPFNDIAAVESAIRPETAAILLEPIQGEGGVNQATPEFIRAVAEICEKHDLLLFFDEVQVGFGRCGDSMAWRMTAPEIRPDGISWAKGMGGGVPIGAFWLSDRAIDRDDTPLSSLLGPGSHGSTYGGNPLVCRLVLAGQQAGPLCHSHVLRVSLAHTILLMGPEAQAVAPPVLLVCILWSLQLPHAPCVAGALTPQEPLSAHARIALLAATLQLQQLFPLPRASTVQLAPTLLHLWHLPPASVVLLAPTPPTPVLQA